jgi:hypothetical protein
MKVKLRSEISGSRDGQAWPSAGSEIDLPDDEAAALCASGAARPVGDRKLNEEHAVVLDEATEQRVRAATTTRERAARTKRAHEPVNLGAADEEQPDEADNGPRLPEVNGAEAAKVEDPAKPTQSEDGVSGRKTKIVEGK